MNTALVIKETQKAIFVEFGAFVYNKCIRIKTWLPKSQITIKDNVNDKISFEINNNWLLTAKMIEYAKYLESNGYSMCEELRTLSSLGRNEDVEYCFA